MKRPALREEIEVFADRFYTRRTLPMEMSPINALHFALEAVSRHIGADPIVC